MVKFIENGKCTFAVVKPAKASLQQQFAIGEFIHIVKKACGDEPRVLNDTDDLPENCVHIGQTLTAAAVGVNPTTEQTGDDGYIIARRGNDVFITSAGREGVIYGVYAFFAKLIGAEFYAHDEWFIPSVSDVELFDGDVIVKPDIEKRLRNLEWSNRDRPTERRLGFDEGNGIQWVLFGHTHFTLIPKEKYFEDHPDFYSPDGWQLCLSNPQLIDVMINEVISRLTPDQFETADMIAISIGHEDNGSFCNCPRCRREVKKYGKAGVMMRFINPVADAVNAFVKENYPGKTVKIVTFGYGPTIDPPVKYDKDGNCFPVDESVKAHENVGIMLAPLGSDWAHSLLDPEYNGRTRSSLMGWNAVGADLFIWTYDGVFDDFIPMDNWKHLQESYRTFKKLNAVYLFDESAMRGRQFENMCHYVRGKLMWDMSLDLDALVRKFMRGYYKEAADTVYEYYLKFRAHTDELEKELNQKGRKLNYRSFIRTQPYWKSEDFWSREWLESALSLLISGRDKLKDEGRYGARNRLEVEMLSPLYLYLEIYGHLLPKEKLKEYIDAFERVCTLNGIETLGAHMPLYKKTVMWRSLLRAKES